MIYSYNLFFQKKQLQDKSSERLPCQMSFMYVYNPFFMQFAMCNVFPEDLVLTRGITRSLLRASCIPADVFRVKLLMFGW